MRILKLVYIASPYRGDVDHNTSKAKEYCRFAVSQGAIPLAPHIYFTQFLDDNIPEERELGLRMGLEIMEQCEEIWVMGDRISEGMAAEIEAAKRLRMRIQYYTEEWQREFTRKLAESQPDTKFKGNS